MCESHDFPLSDISIAMAKCPILSRSLCQSVSSNSTELIMQVRKCASNQSAKKVNNLPVMALKIYVLIDMVAITVPINRYTFGCSMLCERERERQS